MKTNFKALIFFIVSIISFYSCGNAYQENLEQKKSGPISVNNIEQRTEVKHGIPGYWVWDKEDDNNSFTISIEEKDSFLLGYYCATRQQGEKIDCSYDELSFKIPLKVKDKVTTDFLNYYSSTMGKVKLELVGEELHWEIIEEPSGIFYCPRSAILKQPKDLTPSGNYEAFTVAFSKTGDKVSGYYEDYRGKEQGSSPSFSCLFYFQGVKTGLVYSITVYSNSLEKITTGTLTPGDYNSSPIIKLVLKENPPGCIQINEFKKEQVCYLDNKSEFISINLIKSPKAYFYLTSDETSIRKAYVIKGDWVKILKEENGFAYVEYGKETKTKGWIKKVDFL